MKPVADKDPQPAPEASPEKIEEDDDENDKEEDTNNVTNNNAQPQIWRPPVRRFVNPYDEFIKEQERIMQARKEAKEKYSKISAT